MGTFLDEGHYLQFILSVLLRKIVVPGDYHGRVRAVKQMLIDDVSGLVDSLTDFFVTSASVDYRIETKNDSLNSILAQWLEEINIEYNGQIPMGINALAEEYFKERWKSSSFPIMKVAKWREVNGIIVPSKLFFLDGESIAAKEKDDSDKYQRLIAYDYYLSPTFDKMSKLGDNVIYSKPFARWQDQYPVPFLIKRGIYHNWRLIQSLKNHEGKILEQVIPYLLLIKKGTEGLAVQKDVNYSNEQLQGVIDQFQALMETIKETKRDTHDVKAPIRATQFDEEIKHLIPDLKTIFQVELFQQSERNILSGMGMIDITEATSNSRKESILNPKGFVEEIKKGVSDFKNHFLKQLVYQIKKKNESHNKFMNEKFYVCSSPVKAFMTNDFKELIRQMYDRGRISSQTAVELIAEIDFETEVYRREQETKREIEQKMYPVVTRNDEDKGIDNPSNPDIDEEEIPDDKKDPTEKQEYDIGKINLEGAPYSTIKQLPKSIRENMTKSLQRVFVSVFNKAYNTYNSEERAFKIAWGALKRIAKKNSEGKWVRKGSRAKLTKAILEDVLDAEQDEVLKDLENQATEEAFKKTKLEIAKQQKQLLTKLLENK